MVVQVIVLVVLVLVTAVLGAWWTARQGAVRAPRKKAVGEIDWASSGIALADKVTFVQFSAEVCAACRSTSRILAGLTGTEHGVGHSEVLVDNHLDLVRRLGVLRTPTVLVIDGGGREMARMSGVVSGTQARQALNRTPLKASEAGGGWK